MTGHPIVHLEIAAKNPAELDKFYANVFGWKTEVDSQFDYHQFSAEGGPGGGFVQTDGKTYNPGDIVPYHGVDNIDTMLDKIQSKGGKVLMQKTEIPGMGWYALFADPAGNRLGLYEVREQAV